MLAKKENRNTIHPVEQHAEGRPEEAGARRSFKRQSPRELYTFTSTLPAEQADMRQENGRTIVPVYLDTTHGKRRTELGRNLLRMSSSIDQGDALPDTIICLNKGVFMTTEDAHAIATLRSLSAKGVSIISCGTCLDYYHLTEKLHVGSIGNMHEIANKLVHAKHIVKP